MSTDIQLVSDEARVNTMTDSRALVLAHYTTLAGTVQCSADHPLTAHSSVVVTATVAPPSSLTSVVNRHQPLPEQYYLVLVTCNKHGFCLFQGVRGKKGLVLI